MHTSPQFLGSPAAFLESAKGYFENQGFGAALNFQPPRANAGRPGCSFF
jgi:hypothetical protein